MILRIAVVVLVVWLLASCVVSALVCGAVRLRETRRVHRDLGLYNDDAT